MANIVSTIGSNSRDYATLALWDANELPANLVTDGNSYEADMYNDTEFTGSSGSYGTGAHTTDATHVILITAGPGQSFQDNANVRTNALTYNQANGVGMQNTNNWQGTFNADIDYLTVSRIQLKNSGGTSNPVVQMRNGSMKDCIIYLNNSTDIAVAGFINTQVSNLLIICDNSANSTAVSMNYSSSITTLGLTVVRPTNWTAIGTGIGSNATDHVLNSCAIFGFTTPVGAGFSASSLNNGTDQSSGLPGSGQQYSITYDGTHPFVNTSTASAPDFRTIIGNNLVANGYLDSTNAPNDISGTPRPASPTIGCWEPSSSYPRHGDFFFAGP